MVLHVFNFIKMIISQFYKKKNSILFKIDFIFFIKNMIFQVYIHKKENYFSDFILEKGNSFIKKNVV